jgi:uncharacterized integral membrane protein
MSAPGEGRQPPVNGGVIRRGNTQLVAAGTLAVVLIVFAVLNSQTVKIHWIVTTTRSPLILVIVVAGLLGLSVGWFLARRRARHLR